MVSLDCTCQKLEPLLSKGNDTVRKINTAIVGCVISFTLDFIKLAVGYESMGNQVTNDSL